MLTREDLRLELRAFVVELLEVEMPVFQSHLQQGIRASLDEMIVHFKNEFSDFQKPIADRPLCRRPNLSHAATIDALHSSAFDEMPEQVMTRQGPIAKTFTPTPTRRCLDARLLKSQTAPMVGSLPRVVAPEVASHVLEQKALAMSEAPFAEKPSIVSSKSIMSSKSQPFAPLPPGMVAPEMAEHTPEETPSTMSECPDSAKTSIGSNESWHATAYFPGASAPEVILHTSEDRGSSKETTFSKKQSLTSNRSGQITHATKRGSVTSVSSSTSDTKKPVQRVAANIVNKNSFDYVIAGLILANGIMIGIQTDYLARENMEDPPSIFHAVEIFFCIVFTGELALRLFAFQCKFFTMSWWNLFDFTIVSLQLLEIFMSLVAAGVGFSFNILRIRRLARVARLARALRLIGELRTIVSSIAGSVKPLFWTALLLFIIAYVFGVAVTQLVHMKTQTMREQGEPLPDNMDLYWGNLGRAIFTLIQSITGGVDWGRVCQPLLESMGVEVVILITVYVLFSSLAMLNVVTGVFIDAVMENSKRAKEQCTFSAVHALMAELDINQDGVLSWEEFEAQLNKKEMKDFFRIVDVDISNAPGLFMILDKDGSGTIDAAELMEGCLRIWAPAKDLDVRMLSRDIYRLGNQTQDLIDVVSVLQKVNQDAVEALHKSPASD